MMARKLGLAGGFGLALTAVLATGAPDTALGQDATIVSHAITTFGDPPKYPADFAILIM